VVVREPGADLGVALAIASAGSGRPLPADVVVCGEVGLGGELRQVAQTQRRLAEAARLGFTAAIVPRLAPEPPSGITALRADDLLDAISLAGLAPVEHEEPPPRLVAVGPNPFP
jgi:DNA repair protein RadA/Sms